MRKTPCETLRTDGLVTLIISDHLLTFSIIEGRVTPIHLGEEGNTEFRRFKGIRLYIGGREDARLLSNEASLAVDDPVKCQNLSKSDGGK